jgi:hypothetical protein
VFGGVVGGVGVPAGPDDPQPGAAEDADSPGVTLAAGAGVGIQLGGPWGAVAGIVGEDVQALAGGWNRITSGLLTYRGTVLAILPTQTAGEAGVPRAIGSGAPAH